LFARPKINAHVKFEEPADHKLRREGCWTTQNMDAPFSGLVMRTLVLIPWTLLILFHWTSRKPERCICGVAIDAATVASKEQHLIGVIGSGGRFDWSDDQVHTIRVIGDSNYRLITGSSTYWYGPDDSRGANRWSQGTQTVGDYGFAMSRQNIAVPGSGSNNISFMF
jgi:hypothetical protein